MAEAEGEVAAREQVAEARPTFEEEGLVVAVAAVAEGRYWHFYSLVGTECGQGEWAERWWWLSWEWRSEVAEVRALADVVEEVEAGVEVVEGEDGERRDDVGKVVEGAGRNGSVDQEEGAAVVAVAEGRQQVQRQDGAQLAVLPRLVRQCDAPCRCLRRLLHRHRYPRPRHQRRRWHLTGS